MQLKGRRRRADSGRAAIQVAPESPAPAVVLQVSALPSMPTWSPSIFDGSKFPGGMPAADALWRADYWTLRRHSSRLFETNLYARGLIRRLVTNEINTGLHLESTPIEKLLGIEEEGLAEWSETTETLFEVWGADPRLCDVTELRTFGALQQAVRMQALVDGDVLIVLRQSKVTGLPRLQVISGTYVQNPIKDDVPGKNKICHGVELDAQGRQVAYWVTQEDGTSQRLPAYGEKSGRRLAWLVYGTDRRHDDVRGKPLLALVIQSLKEIDRFRDATQRKAVLNSMLAMFVKKTADKPGTQPLTGGAIRRGVETTVDTTGRPRRFAVAEGIPGLVIDELQVGEEPAAFPQNGATEGYGEFEEAIIQAVAWANEIPPEILRLTFSSNYSASKAANNEFDMYVTKVRTQFGDEFCRPIYVEWVIASTLAQVIKAAGLVEAWRDSKRFVEFGAWTACDWSGQIKPSIDLSKMVTAYEGLINLGLITRDRAARELTGMKFSRVIRQLERENVAVAKANEPIKQLEAPASAAPATPAEDNIDDTVDEDTGDQKNGKAA
jgi:capsid protein